MPEIIKSSKKKGSAPAIQYHFTVPQADTDVIKWIECQDRLSISIRAVIKEIVKRYGFVDVFCRPVTNPGTMPGRPVSTNEASEGQEMFTAPSVQQVQIRQPVVSSSADSGDINDALASLL